MNTGKWMALPLRVTLGVMFLAHGCQKTFGWFGGGGLDQAIATAGHVGFAPAVVGGWALALSELIGGLFLTLGFLTRCATIPLIVIMGVAVASVHGPNGFFMQQGGFEYNWVILGGLLALLIGGGGVYSLDQLHGGQDVVKVHVRRDDTPEPISVGDVRGS